MYSLCSCVFRANGELRGGKVESESCVFDVILEEALG